MEEAMSEQSSVIVQRLKAVSPREAAEIEDCGKSVIYERLARGEYDAYKDGNRTKIILESIERRRATLPSYRDGKCSPPPAPKARSRRT
jgi:transposase